MLQKPSQKIRRQIMLISTFLALASCVYAYSNWQIFKDDDGSLDSYWGCCGAPAYVLCKTFVLDKAGGAKDAMIRYEIGTEPYHSQTKAHYAKPQEGVQWNDMVIMVNDVVVARDSPMKLGVKGWHRVQFDPKLLKQGENTVKFTWSEGGTKEGAGTFYMGIDTATRKERSSASWDGGKTFQKECLRMGMGPGPVSPEWQGEYMVRLFVAFSDQGAETQSASNTAVNAANP